MAKTTIHTIDLQFQGVSHAIAAYLIKVENKGILIESGPGSTVSALQSALAAMDLELSDITHVLLTHIHLDHAGAAGRLAQAGATICVHPLGAPHLINPEKLIASATRIYGDSMGTLWGDFFPVPESKIKVVEHAVELSIHGINIVPFHTPGHAEHHVCYLVEGTCFTGDVGGVRIPGTQYLQVPMPPPELNFEKWYSTLSLLRGIGMEKIAPTHFGVFEDPRWQLAQVEEILQATEKWMENVMPGNPPIEVLREEYLNWIKSESAGVVMDDQLVKDYDLANPLGMSADGIMRYWKKTRQQL